MSLPDAVTQHLEGERPVAEVGLGGEDHLYVTPTRTLIYRAEGLLSDETVEEYPHDAERIVVSEGRRKAKVTMDYGLEGEESFSLPKDRLDDALHPVIAGVLNAAEITAAGETVKRTFRFSELTLVVTSDRVVKHIGQAVWDEDFEEYHFDDVTDLTFEHGNVATSVVLSLGGRQERFKAPNEDARAVQETITSALLDYHDVATLEELRAMFAEEEAVDDEADRGSAADVFGEGPDLLSTGGEDDDDTDDLLSEDPLGSPAASGSDGGVEATSPSTDDEFEPATERVVDPESPTANSGTQSVATSVESSLEIAELREEMQALKTTVSEQRDQMERQNDLIEQLIEELRQGR